MLPLAGSNPLPWADPMTTALAVARASEGGFAFLHSSLRTRYSGRYSLLAWNPVEEIRDPGTPTLATRLTTSQPCFTNAWFGALAYELRHETETLTPAAPGAFGFANVHFFRPRHLLVWDHETRTLHDAGVVRVTLPLRGGGKGGGQPAHDTDANGHNAQIDLSTLSSNLTRAEYFAAVENLREAILSGRLYQANLTRKCSGRFTQTPDAPSLFARLCEVSPAPYSALLRLDDTWILSSSPERFLTMDESGKATTRPIKGSCARADNSDEDARLAAALQASPKDRAENLMIVDLMRNDFSRGAIPGSVRVEELCALDIYATVHHLSSTVNAQRRADVTPLDFTRHCFPPGSMTGAPKIAAMEHCTKLEQIERGIYSGALGWFGGDGSLDLSVVIRTLIVRGRDFEFQVGGGIVADSTPEGEWRETVTKARGICAALGFTAESLVESSVF
ncbi:MAG: anthranilate synthase component I family protein [Alphaproteobacteria bacterium]|nr:anthranilate synthase component I family protein [Alphaproteobacteria bacterium]